jgi:branched-chain amino acid aminotransferase
MPVICLNGQFTEAGAGLGANSPGLRYGEGLFETVKLVNGALPFFDLHSARLFDGLALLGIDPPFTPEGLQALFLALCQQNGLKALARLRVWVYRDEPGASYYLEAFPAETGLNHWLDSGLSLCLFPPARKAQDAFSNLKSANYLPYIQATRFALAQGFDEALLLNHEGLLCDASRANLFIIREGTFLTPALHQGCVKGVMRQFVIRSLAAQGVVVQEDRLSEEDLLRADEVFLTNALYGIRPVARYRNTHYGSGQTRALYTRLFSTIWS